MFFVRPGHWLLILLIATGCQQTTMDSGRIAKSGEVATSAEGNETGFGKTATNEKVNSGQPRPSGEADPLRILHWNIESGGANPKRIAEQLGYLTLAGYHVFALSEVDDCQTLIDGLEVMNPGVWKRVVGNSGIIPDREDDRLMVFIDSRRLELIDSQELTRHGEYPLNDGRHRSPLLLRMNDKQTGQMFLLMQNHLARGNAEFRTTQAIGLREFARDSSQPIIAVGDYNFDFIFATESGNEGLNEMMRDDVWKWIRPEEWIDTNWFDEDKDGADDYPGSLLDFSFVSGVARNWHCTSRVLVLPGDFPDDWETSDHRPVELIVNIQ